MAKFAEYPIAHWEWFLISQLCFGSLFYILLTMNFYGQTNMEKHNTAICRTIIYYRHSTIDGLFLWVVLYYHSQYASMEIYCMQTPRSQIGLYFIVELLTLFLGLSTLAFTVARNVYCACSWLFVTDKDGPLGKSNC